MTSKQAEAYLRLSLLALILTHMHPVEAFSNIFSSNIPSISEIFSSGRIFSESSLTRASNDGRYLKDDKAKEDFNTNSLHNDLTNPWSESGKIAIQESSPKKYSEGKQKEDFLSFYYGNDTNDHQTGNGVDEEQEKHAFQSSLVQDHWTRLKLILQNMKGILESQFPQLNQDDQVTFQILDRIISFGDKMDILKRINKTFNNGLMEFLSHKWNDISGALINGSPILKTLFTIDSQDITNSLMMPVVRQIASYFKNSALKHLKDLDFVVELMKSSGFHENEIMEVFNLLGLEEDNQKLEAEGRQYGGMYHNIEKAGGGGGYGHSGGYPMHGGGGGYMMQTIDPFVLLAGLAFATFLAFLLFRLLSQTTGKRRSVPDMSLNLDLSDMPGVMNNIYSFLDTAERKFGDNATDVFDPISDFGSSANSLWASFKADRMEKSCMKRFLCDKVIEGRASIDSSEASSALHHLALTALAQLLGEEGGAKLMDGLQQDFIAGRPQNCPTIAPRCDDNLYLTQVKTSHSVMPL